MQCTKASTSPLTKREEFSNKSTVTEFSSATSDTSNQQKVLYIMSLEPKIWEQEEVVRQMFAKESDDKSIFVQTSTLRCGQQYLRAHRIFDFLQFLIAHIQSTASGVESWYSSNRWTTRTLVI